MDNELQIFDGLKVKEENGQVMFDAETVAIGVGLTQVKNDVIYVRWGTLNKYLKLSQEVGKGDFITESQMYKLALKTGSSKAEKFQDWVTEEVLPSIRKTGTYQAKSLTLPEQIQTVAQGYVEIEKDVSGLKDDVQELKDNEEIRSWERKQLLSIRREKVLGYLTGINDPDKFKSARSKLYQAIGSDFKRQFNLPAYDALPRKQFQMGRDFMINWVPDEWTRAAIAGMELTTQEA
ncbi:ORF6C domain-containing protein [Weissella minor]|uniref:ORF6C domain-containing protein n=1 Tax=Weissella minor TaxID=1620 RepID=UPI003AF26895